MRPTEELIGKIIHKYPKLGVVVVKLESELTLGDRIRIEAELTFEQDIESIQVDRKDVKTAVKGQNIGIKLEGKAAIGDLVYRINKNSEV